ncbi:hypothetical protein PybrP1_000946 [[Pythium] brassicae (nom. inval.)]|nr:hypothetical protein PybrP1_000946 [[Pythium] brassicae (nom. inval.)]
MTTPRKVLVVGAGVTGAAIAQLLQSVAVVWEKNNIAGGRMMARSFRKNRDVHVDIGAQYLTRFTAENDDVRTLVSQQLTPFDERLISQDAHREPSRISSRNEHTVTPNVLGFRALVQQLLDGTPTTLSRELERFEILNESQIRVTAADGHEEIVNDLVLTCPVPNYSQRFALAYLFDTEVASRVRELGWTAKYVSKEEDDVVRYLCWDNLKKPISSSGDHYALLVHTTVSFGVEHMDNKEQNDEIVATVTKSVKKLLPFLPVEQDVLLHRWRISQVTSTYADPDGKAARAVVLSHSPKIVVAGDAFLGSTFDNCLLSAKAAAKIIDSSIPASGL